jgi:hypothetical protein
VVQHQHHEQGKMGMKSFTMTERKITENASGAAMEREGSVKSLKQVDVTRNRLPLAASRSSRIKLTREVAPANDVEQRGLSAQGHNCTATHDNIDIVLSHDCGPWLTARVRVGNHVRGRH